MSRYIVLLLLMVSPSLAAVGYVGHKPTVGEVRELLLSVCSSGVKTGACTPCPAFVEGGENEKMTLEAVTYGKFLNNKDTYALLDLSGCEPHVNNFGSSVLLRWRGLTRRDFVKYIPGYRTSDCLKFPARDGRDLLLCEVGYAGMGTVILSLLLEDFRIKQTDTQQLFSTYDSSGACLTEGSIQALLEWKQVSLNADRYPDLRAKVKLAVYTRKGAKADDPCTPEITPGQSRTYTLEYTFDGGKFTLTAATRAALKQPLKDNPYLM